MKQNANKALDLSVCPSSHSGKLVSSKGVNGSGVFFYRGGNVKKRKVDPWFPFWIDKWLFGSTRIELEPDERGVFVDLISLSKKDSGYIRANEGVPYLENQLCGLLNITPELFQRTVKKCIKYGKTEKLKDGTLYMTSYKIYSLSPRQERRIKDSQGDYFVPKYGTFMPCPEKYKSMATKKGLVRVSRLMVAIVIGRSLRPKEQIHHIDGNDKNDGIENLMLFQSQKEHLRYQHGYKEEFMWRGDKLSSDEIKDMSVKIKDIILDKNILNNNKKENIIKEKKASITFNFETENWENIKDKDIKRWKETYPACDIKQELLYMADWLISNPSKKKSNYARFISNWLRKQQDQGGTKKGIKPSDFQIGKSTKKPTEIQEKYYEARRKKQAEIQTKHKKEIEKIRKKGDKIAGEILQKKIDEEVAEWSEEYLK